MARVDDGVCDDVRDDVDDGVRVRDDDAVPDGGGVVDGVCDDVRDDVDEGVRDSGASHVVTSIHDVTTDTDRPGDILVSTVTKNDDPT